MAFRLIKLPKHKTFEYTPRYYNEQKEELQERVKKIEREMGVKSPDYKYVPNIKGQIRPHYNRATAEKKQSSLRLILILVILFVLAYLLFFRAVL